MPEPQPEDDPRPAGGELRFCPYCFQMAFELSKISGDYIFCEICGVDVEVKELVKQ